MITAPVGFQCPACVAEGKQQIRTFTPTRPVVTTAIIAICVAVFAVETLTGTDFTYNYGLAGYAINPMGEYYRFVTAMFLHGGFMHIAFNMLILWQLGSILEGALGTRRFIALYLLSGLGGGIVSVMLNDPMVVSVGASGAIFGLMGAYAVLAKKMNLNSSQIVGLIGINLVIGFVVPNIDWHAHVGGLLVGSLVAYLLTAQTSRR